MFLRYGNPGRQEIQGNPFSNTNCAPFVNAGALPRRGHGADALLSQVVMLGDSTVGKSSILYRLKFSSFSGKQEVGLPTTQIFQLVVPRHCGEAASSAASSRCLLGEGTPRRRRCGPDGSQRGRVRPVLEPWRQSPLRAHFPAVCAASRRSVANSSPSRSRSRRGPTTPSNY